MGLRGPAGLEERFGRLSRKGGGKETKKQEEVFDVGCAEIFLILLSKGLIIKLQVLTVMPSLPLRCVWELLTAKSGGVLPFL